MSLVTMNWQPTQKQLRDFGLIALVVLPPVAILLHYFKDLAFSLVLCICFAGLFLYILSRISAGMVRPVYIVLQLVTLPIGFVVSYTVMAIFYYLVITPVGLVFKLIGRDSLNRRFDRQADTYWIRHHPADSAKRYFNQF